MDRERAVERDSSPLRMGLEVSKNVVAHEPVVPFPLLRAAFMPLLQNDIVSLPGD
jgi:hypothetical protein